MNYQEFLSDTHPLMEKFKNIAPASLKHCQNVAFICDSIATEIQDVNKELLHVAALYHDVGKLMSPNYYIENQTGENLHEDLPPRVSYELITRHVSDSAALLASYNSPVEVIQVILEHHGTSVVRYFQKKSSDDEENYRYKWNPPSTKESAILMIVDVVEATAKSLSQSGKLGDSRDNHQTLVEDTIDRLVDDGQLDVLTYGVARIIKKILPRELESLYHKRVDYDEASESKSRKVKTK